MHNLLKINIVKMAFFDNKCAFLCSKNANSIQSAPILSFRICMRNSIFWKEIEVWAAKHRIAGKAGHLPAKQNLGLARERGKGSVLFGNT